MSEPHFLMFFKQDTVLLIKTKQNNKSKLQSVHGLSSACKEAPLKAPVDSVSVDSRYHCVKSLGTQDYTKYSRADELTLTTNKNWTTSGKNGRGHTRRAPCLYRWVPGNLGKDPRWATLCPRLPLQLRHRDRGAHCDVWGGLTGKLDPVVGF